MAATSVADCPGPPAMKNTGSGLLLPPASLSSQAIFNAMLRPLGAAGFSGTRRLAHCASIVPAAPPALSVHGVNSNAP